MRRPAGSAAPGPPLRTAAPAFLETTRMDTGHFTRRHEALEVSRIRGPTGVFSDTPPESLFT